MGRHVDGVGPFRIDDYEPRPIVKLRLVFRGWCDANAARIVRPERIGELHAGGAQVAVHFVAFRFRSLLHPCRESLLTKNPHKAPLSDPDCCRERKRRRRAARRNDDMLAPVDRYG